MAKTQLFNKEQVRKIVATLGGDTTIYADKRSKNKGRKPKYRTEAARLKARREQNRLAQIVYRKKLSALNCDTVVKSNGKTSKQK